MAFVFDNRQRQGLPRVFEALQRWEEDPELLRLERAQRYSDPPPPYPSSGETTQPDSPAEAPVVDESALRVQRNRSMLQSVPSNQFSSQVRRTRERLEYLSMERRYGRKETLHYDNTLDLRANAENHVRSRWVEQGIWKEEWGSAWPKGAQPSDNRWFYSQQNPGGGPRPSGRWGHERVPTPEPSPEPEPEPKPTLNIFPGLRQKKPDPDMEGLENASAPGGTGEPAATSERDTSASRPYHQFLFQVSKEREWISDELLFKRSTGRVDIDAMAYESVKKIWIEDELWNPTWGELPGMTWRHEDLLEEIRQKSKPQPDAARNDEQRPHLSSPEPSIPEPIPGGDNDHTDDNNPASGSEEVNPAIPAMTRARGKGKRTKGPARQSTVNKSPRAAEEPIGRVLRNVRSSKVVKPGKPRSTALKTRSSAPKARPQSLVPPNSTSRKPGDVGANLTSGNEPSYTKQRFPATENQPPAAIQPLRRSARIAAQKGKTPIEHKSKTTASSTGNVKGRSRPTLRTTSTTANSNRTRQQKRSSKSGRLPRRR
ncbi:hypothetical protein CC80DRAFT_162235 [Byssothecium circinans]|uniref:Uncharacterized protein n=1 Tax=Byssothecium circinans TaxID=147558 RepID=A0A6A5UFJ7_9PLEO|nr:hypothetical protein CC80DRAFT_162235 [Byssothecium circinans]